MMDMMGMGGVDPADMSMGMPPVPPPLPPEPLPDIPADAPQANPKIAKEIETYAKGFMRASADYVGKKQGEWKKWWKLYRHQLTRTQWANWAAGGVSVTNDGQTTHYSERKISEWSEFVFSPEYLIDKWVDNAFPRFFGMSDYFVVTPTSTPQDSNIEDIEYPTARKLQQFLITKLNEGKFASRIYEVLQQAAIFGSCYVKLHWMSDTIPRYKWDLESVERVEDDPLKQEVPLISIIPLDKFLPDPDAESNDIQRWRMVGHRVEKEIEMVLAGYERGVYRMNKKKFEELFKTGSGRADIVGSSILKDPDATNLLGDKTRKCQVWECHGKVPTSDGIKEIVITLATECGIDDPSAGVVLRIIDGPILDCGLRPFVGTSYTPQAGSVFGVGMIERNEELLYELSQLIGQFQDNLKASIGVSYIVVADTDADEVLKANGDTIPPGTIFRKEPGAEPPIAPVAQSQFPANEVSKMIQFLLQQLERRDSLPDLMQGISGSDRQTATESNHLFTQGNIPVETRVSLIARSLMSPAGRIALAMCQQFLIDDQLVTVRDDLGQDVPIPITAEEIQSGTYNVEAAIVREDQQAIAKLQIVQQMLPVAVNCKPIVEAEGQVLEINELFKQALIYAKVEKPDRIVHPAPPPPPPGMMGPQGFPPGPGGPSVGPGSAPPPPPGPAYPLAQNGGPMGPTPNDANMQAQMLQMQAAQQVQPRG